MRIYNETKEKSLVCAIWDLMMLVLQCIIIPFILCRYDNMSYWLLLVSAFVVFNVWLIIGNLLYKSNNKYIKRGTAIYRVIATGIGELFGAASINDVKIDEGTQGISGCLSIFLEVSILLIGVELYLIVLQISFDAPFYTTFGKIICFLLSLLFTIAMTSSFWYLLVKRK